MSKLVLVHLETVLLSVQDRCTVYAKRTRGSEIVLDKPDGTPRWQGVGTILDAPKVLLGDKAQVEARFSLFGDSANLDARYVHGLCQHTRGLEIVLDKPDGTPR
jgi:hypothetical protein